MCSGTPIPYIWIGLHWSEIHVTQRCRQVCSPCTSRWFKTVQRIRHHQYLTSVFASFNTCYPGLTLPSKKRCRWTSPRLGVAGSDVSGQHNVFNATGEPPFLLRAELSLVESAWLSRGQYSIYDFDSQMLHFSVVRSWTLRLSHRASP